MLTRYDTKNRQDTLIPELALPLRLLILCCHTWVRCHGSHSQRGFGKL
jgi:hypothetical protein